MFTIVYICFLIFSISLIPQLFLRISEDAQRIWAWISFISACLFVGFLQGIFFAFGQW